MTEMGPMADCPVEGWRGRKSDDCVGRGLLSFSPHHFDLAVDLDRVIITSVEFDRLVQSDIRVFQHSVYRERVSLSGFDREVQRNLPADRHLRFQLIEQRVVFVLRGVVNDLS
jgi:hypothetical protein